RGTKIISQFIAPGFLREVRAAKETDDGLNAAGVAGVAASAFEAILLVGDPQQAGEMAAGRRTGRADTVRIDVVLAGGGPQPPRRSLAVLDLSGEGGVGHEAVADGGRDVAAPRQHLGHEIHILPLTLVPAAAVDADHRREWALALGHGKVQLQFHPAALAVDDVTLDTDLRLLSLRCRSHSE